MSPSTGGGSYLGLLQVGASNVLPSYNSRHRTNYSRNDLFDPEINIKIATDLLNRIVVAFGKHPDPNMKMNWSNPEFVKLILAGWNSGYSEAGGLGRVAQYLESRKVPVTHNSVFENAAAAGATTHLQNSRKQSWQRGVADLYFRQPDAPTPGSLSGGFLVKASIAVLLGLLAAKYVFV